MFVVLATAVLSRESPTKLLGVWKKSFLFLRCLSILEGQKMACSKLIVPLPTEVRSVVCCVSTDRALFVQSAVCL